MPAGRGLHLILLSERMIIVMRVECVDVLRDSKLSTQSLRSDTLHTATAHLAVSTRLSALRSVPSSCAGSRTSPEPSHVQQCQQTYFAMSANIVRKTDTTHVPTGGPAGAKSAVSLHFSKTADHILRGSMHSRPRVSILDFGSEGRTNDELPGY